MGTCKLCDGSMVAGDGSALFTAGCSHSFHFNCFRTSVKYGNQNCPTCGTKWNVGPAPAPIPQPIPPPTGYRPYPIGYHPSLGYPPSLLGPPPPPVRTSSSEPLVFNDDDPLNLPSNSSSDNTSVTRSVDIKTHTELPAVKRSVSQENFHILVNLKSNVTGIDQVNRAPLDLVTVLDVSGSMRGEKIELLQRAMRFVIQNLGPSDRLSVVSFSHNSHRLFPLLLMNDSGKQRALHAVNSLFAGGGTDIVQGLKMGTKVIEDRGHKNPVHSIMLLSDGEDTCTNVKMINLKEISKVQVPVHTFGFGEDHDSVMLHSIAESSKGTFSFIEDEGVIQDAFAQRIGGLLSVAVQDLQVHIKSLDLCINQLKAGSYSTSLTGENQVGSVDIGDLYADEERDFLVLVNIPAVTDENSNDQIKLVSVWCDYKDPLTKQCVTTEAVEVNLQRPEMVTEEDMVVSLEVDRQKNRLQAAEAMRSSRAAADRGDLTRARSIIDGCRTRMAETISMYACDELAEDLDLELEEAASRMANQNTYQSKGRGFLLAGAFSHFAQQACYGGAGFACSTYQTDNMRRMVDKSRDSARDNTHQKRHHASVFPPANNSTHQKRSHASVFSSATDNTHKKRRRHRRRASLFDNTHQKEK